MKFEEALQIPTRSGSVRLVIGPIDIWFNSPDDEDGFNDNWIDDIKEAQMIERAIRVIPEMLVELEKCRAFISSVNLSIGSATRMLEIDRIFKMAKGE